MEGILATNLEGDSKKDVVEVVPSVCSYPKKLVSTNAGIALLPRR